LEVLDDLKAGLLKDGLNAETFNRLKQAAIARQSWAVQGNSAQAEYNWSALGDYEDGRFANPVKELQAVTLAEANKAMRELLLQPGYVRIEKPLVSYDQLMWAIAGLSGLLLLSLAAWRFHRRK
jgi:predicted Zn-dependent peptidase